MAFKFRRRTVLLISAALFGFALYVSGYVYLPDFNQNSDIVKTYCTEEICLEAIFKNNLIQKDFGTAGFLLKKHQDSDCNQFTFTIKMTPTKQSMLKDIVYYNIKDYSEYEDRIHLLNFQMKKHFSLNSKNISLKPVLCEMESTYGLTASRVFNVVFVPRTTTECEELKQVDELKLKYNDPVFNTGITTFEFNQLN